MMDKAEVPSGWVYATVGDVVANDGIFTDGDWVETKDQDPNGDVRLVQLADVGDGGFLDKSSRFLTRAKAYELNCTFLTKGDLLVARMPDPLGRCCIFPLDGAEKYVTVVDVCAVRFGTSSIVPKYMMYAINSPRTRTAIEALKSGSTRKRISRGNLARVEIPVAPNNEQHRIVAKIEELFSELDKGIESLKTAWAQLKVYRQAILKHAFEGKLTARWREENKDKLEKPEQLLARIKKEREARYEQQLKEWKAAVKGWEAKGKLGKKPLKPRDPNQTTKYSKYLEAERNELPFGWTWAKIESIFDVVSGGTPKGLEHAEDGDIPFYKVSDMNTLGNETKMAAAAIYLSEPQKNELGLTAYPEGTVIFPKRGGAILTNKKRILSRPSCFDLNTMGVVNSITCISNEYLWHWFQSLDLAKIYDGSNVPQINNKNVEPLPFLICSIEEQREIASMLEKTLSLLDDTETEISQELQKADALRQSILKNAFSGQLVAQDPHDEPASVLLDRIKAERERAVKNKTPKKKKKRRTPA